MTESTKTVNDKVTVTHEEMVKLVLELDARQKEFLARLERLESVVQVTVPLSSVPI